MLSVMKELTSLCDEAGYFTAYTFSGQMSCVGEHLATSPTSFISALIARNLSSTQADAHTSTNKCLRKIVTRISEKLKDQKGALYTWNYYPHPHTTTPSPYPDDLDDTCLALTVLHNEGVENIDSVHLGHFLHWLVQCEHSIDEHTSAYNTWILPRNKPVDIAWKDIDIVVQAHIYEFLRNIGAAPDTVLSYIEKCIRESADSLHTASYGVPLHSTYYRYEYILYSLSRVHTSLSIEAIDILKSHLEIALGKANDNLLSLSLLLSTAIRLDHLKSRWAEIVKFLCKKSLSTNTVIHGLYIEYTKEGRTTYCGSHALTLSFIYESIDLYIQTLDDTSHSKDMHHKLFETGLSTEYIQEVTESLSHFNEAAELIDTFTKLEIALEPLRWLVECDGIHNKALSPKEKIAAKKSGTAMLYGWIAFCIYDGLIDKELPLSSLPIANTCHRKCLSLLAELCPDNRKNILHEVMDTLDYAEYKESTSHNSIPAEEWHNHKRLSDKSIGHCLGPIAALIYCRRINNKEAQDIREFYSFFLALKQAHDDAHDLEEDFLAERNTIVTALCEKHMAGSRDLVKLRYVFAHHAVYELDCVMNEWVRKAQDLLTRIEHISPYTEDLSKQVQAYACMSKQVIREVETMKVFESLI